MVDDGLTDNSKSICEFYSNNDKRVVIISQVNKGQSSARNAGLNIATGDYIGFIDSDDYIHKDYINLLVNAICEYDTDGATCDILRFRELLEIQDNVVCGGQC